MFQDVSMPYGHFSLFVLALCVLIAPGVLARGHWGGVSSGRMPATSLKWKPKGPEASAESVNIDACWKRFHHPGPCMVQDSAGQNVTLETGTCAAGVECSWGPRTCMDSHGIFTAHFCNIHRSLVTGHACRVTTETGAELKTSIRPCCQRMRQSPCDLGPLTFRCEDKRSIQAWFCAPEKPVAQDGWFTGLFGGACSVENIATGTRVSTRSCPGPYTCSTGPLLFTHKHVTFGAMFCNVPQRCPEQAATPLNITTCGPPKPEPGSRINVHRHPDGQGHSIKL